MFRARSIRAGMLSLVSLLSIAIPAYAQTDRGTITGQVIDQSAALITGASVKAIHVATNFEREVTTSNEGSYTIPPTAGRGLRRDRDRPEIFKRRRWRTSRSRRAVQVRLDARLAVGVSCWTPSR